MPGAEGVWFNRSKEWAARNRRQEYGTYDFATRYSIRFAQLPAFRHLTPEEYQDRIAGLIREIEEEGERKRDGDPVAGVEKILSQNPLEPPTRQTKRSPKPLFHLATREERDDLEGCYPPALPFRGAPPPKRPPWPPTRRIEKLDSGAVERGEIPVVEIVSAVEARARGQPS